MGFEPMTSSLKRNEDEESALRPRARTAFLRAAGGVSFRRMLPSRPPTALPNPLRIRPRRQIRECRVQTRSEDRALPGGVAADVPNLRAEERSLRTPVDIQEMRARGRPLHLGRVALHRHDGGALSHRIAQVQLLCGEGHAKIEDLIARGMPPHIADVWVLAVAAVGLAEEDLLRSSIGHKEV